ncbi:hypothetical protein [Bdellovibrio bacteriovorus]|uniref:hypothetical protein n=1 Tax=Bdellovibrio TaxID=958 RepID=UPI0035A8C88A
MSFLLFVSFEANAKVYRCNDERDNAYTVSINLQKGEVVALEEGTVIDSEAGKFECSTTSYGRGAIGNQTQCDFVINSGEQLGSITVLESGRAYYQLYIADRNFRGRCH